MKQLNAQAMEKALGHIIQNLGISCLKDSKRFSSAIDDLLPGFEYEAERKALCACICSEVSEKIINAASKSQSERQRVLNSCVKYLTSQQKLTEQQADELVKVFTHILWKEASSRSSQLSNSATKNTVTSQSTVIHSTTVGNTSSTKQIATSSSAANLINIGQMQKACFFLLSMIFFSFIAAVSSDSFYKFLSLFFTILSIISYICAVFLFSESISKKYFHASAFFFFLGTPIGWIVPLFIIDNIVQLLKKYFM